MPSSSSASPTASHSPNVGRLLLITAAVFWSLSGLVAKSPHFESLPIHHRGALLACLRALAAGIALLPFVKWRRIRFRWGLLAMIATFTIMNALYVSALTRTTAAAAIFLQYTSTLWTSLIGALFLREALHKGHLLALGCVLAGIYWIVSGDWGGDRAFGNLLGLLSGVAYAGVVISLRVLREEDSAWLVMLNHLFGGLLLLPWVIALGIRPTGVQLSMAVGLGVFQMGLPYLLFARGVRSVTAQEANLLTLIEAVLIPLWTWMAYGEQASASTWIGGAAILSGLLMQYVIFPGKQRDD